MKAVTILSLISVILAAAYFILGALDMPIIILAFLFLFIIFFITLFRFLKSKEKWHVWIPRMQIALVILIIFLMLFYFGVRSTQRRVRPERCHIETGLNCLLPYFDEETKSMNAEIKNYNPDEIKIIDIEVQDVYVYPSKLSNPLDIDNISIEGCEVLPCVWSANEIKKIIFKVPEIDFRYERIGLKAEIIYEENQVNKTTELLLDTNREVPAYKYLFRGDGIIYTTIVTIILLASIAMFIYSLRKTEA